MQKGHKRSNKGMAVLRFFICLIVVIILVCVVYFFVAKVDYSDKLADPSAQMRAYVEMTASPEMDDSAIGIIGGADGPTSVYVTEPTADIVDLTNTPTPEPTAVPTPTPEPTPIPTPTPVPTPTPEPTPTPTPTPKPTKIPSKKLSKLKRSGFNVPDPSTSATVELTEMYVSEPNANKYVQFKGYGYINEASFDGSTASVFLIVTRQETGEQVAYKASMTPGISGANHEGALCQNPADTDFSVILSVSKYVDGGYDLGIVLYYQLPDGNKAYSYHELGESFYVKDGAITNEVAAFSTPEPVAEEPAEAPVQEEPVAFASDMNTSASTATVG